MRVDWCASSWFRIKNTHSNVTLEVEPAFRPPIPPLAVSFLSFFTRTSNAHRRHTVLGLEGVDRELTDGNRGTRPTSPQTVPRLAAMTAARPITSAVQRSLSGVNTPTRSSVTVSPDFAALRHRSGRTHAGEARQAAVRPRNRLPSLSYTESYCAHG